MFVQDFNIQLHVLVFKEYFKTLCWYNQQSKIVSNLLSSSNMWGIG